MGISSSTPRQFQPVPRGSAINTWLIVLLLGLVGVLVYRQVFRISPLFNPNAESRTVTPRGDFAEDEKSTIELFGTVSPSVVHITTHSIQRNIFTQNVRRTPAGTGSGFVWDREGHIVTNLHVIEQAQDATVTLSDNTNYRARLVGYDTLTDLAVLKIDADAARLVPITIGSSHDLKVGQKVYAIGSPFEFDQTLTTGIISGLNRRIDTERALLFGAIQTDAAINPGNSGGPLLDSAGRLIGVNTAIVSDSGGSHGIGFAVPVDIVNVSVPDIIRDGEVSRPWLGIELRNNVAMHSRDGRIMTWPGIMVVSVDPNGPAGQAGFRTLSWGDDGRLVADLILAVEETEVKTVGEFVAALSQYRPGETVTMVVLREGLEIQFKVTLGEIPGRRRK